MNAPPFPLNPSVGEIAGGYVWNGSMWVANQTVGMQIVTQVFTASGVYMPSPGLTSCIVTCIGGGGGGGGVSNATALEIFAGAGGGSGGLSRKTLPASLVLGGVVVTIGAGGAGGPGTGLGGTAGGATSFGALCVANGGGGGGSVYPSVSAPQPGAGAAPGIGDVAVPGLAGDSGLWQVLATANMNVTVGTANGGDIGYGGTGGHMVGGATSEAGVSSLPNTGAGGSGSGVNQLLLPGSLAGGTGGSGLCIVDEYCFGGQTGGCGPGGAPVPAYNCGPGWGGPC